MDGMHSIGRFIIHSYFQESKDMNATVHEFYFYLFKKVVDLSVCQIN